jgi:hypothetical protein
MPLRIYFLYGIRKELIPRNGVSKIELQQVHPGCNGQCENLMLWCCL